MTINQVIISKYAKDDLREIISYFQSLSPAYVEKTISEFEKNVLSLKDFPKSGRIVPELAKQGIENFRELIQGYYRIIYEISNDTVNVHAIIDGRRDFEDIIISKITRLYGENQ